MMPISSLSKSNANNNDDDDDNKQSLEIENLLTHGQSSSSEDITSFLSKKPYETLPVDCCSLTSTYLGLLFAYHKEALWIILCLVGLGIGLYYVLTTPYNEPVIVNDYSNIKSEYDLKLGKIDHWCLHGDDKSCTCQDPLEPIDAFEKPGWTKAHRKNKELVQNAIIDGRSLDVVFLGDTITEEWDGRWMGNEHNDVTGDLKKIKRTFKKHFTKEGGGSFEGLPLGIAGDTSPQLLWRLLNGEMSDLHPKVWWILIGISDLARRECSEEVTLLGILRIVEEIRRQRPDAIIVINGLIPTTKYKKKDLDEIKMKRFRRWGVPHDLWPSIRTVNKNLMEFASKHKGIKYFNPMDVFTETKEGGGRITVENLMRDPVHPSVLGHKKWADAMVDKLGTMLGVKVKATKLVNVPIDEP